jgi:cell fate regulator YaaT (PSP1 superfamily)
MTTKQEIYISDWFTNKIIVCSAPMEMELPTYGKKVLYQDHEQKSHIWTVLWFPRKTWLKGSLVSILTDTQLEQFNANQRIAREKYFPWFKLWFKDRFPESVPVTARMDLDGRTMYLYFYAEGRYDFAEYVRELRSSIPMRFFIYQVGARDRVRLDPNADGLICASGHGSWLDCKMFHYPLPNVDTDMIAAQWLEWRDIEKLKGICGKLKCSLAYENDRYVKESRNYPKKGRSYDYLGEKVKVIGVNMVMEDIKVRTEEDGNIFTISLSERNSHRQ